MSKNSLNKKENKKEEEDIEEDNDIEDDENKFEENFNDLEDEKIEEIKNEKPNFEKLNLDNKKKQTRSVRVPPTRYKILQKNWESIYTPIVEKLECNFILKIVQIRMNTKKQIIELRTSEYTKEENALQKAIDFITAFLLGKL